MIALPERTNDRSKDQKVEVLSDMCSDPSPSLSFSHPLLRCWTHLSWNGVCSAKLEGSRFCPSHYMGTVLRNPWLTSNSCCSGQRLASGYVGIGSLVSCTRASQSNFCRWRCRYCICWWRIPTREKLQRDEFELKSVKVSFDMTSCTPELAFGQRHCCKDSGLHCRPCCCACPEVGHRFSYQTKLQHSGGHPYWG